MLNEFKLFYYNCYLYYLSYRINNIKNIRDITHIIQNISFFNNNVTSDTIITILTDCFNKYPLSEENTRVISILQQNYEFTHNKEDYCCFILWISIIHSININHKLLL
jgi:hypothetical protein